LSIRAKNWNLRTKKYTKCCVEELGRAKDSRKYNRIAIKGRWWKIKNWIGITLEMGFLFS